MKQKKTLIRNIQKIIYEYGDLSTGDLELQSDPVYGTLGRDVIGLVQIFRQDYAEVTIYVKDREIDYFDVPYEDMERSLLEEIYDYLDLYVYNQEKEKML